MSKTVKKKIIKTKDKPQETPDLITVNTCLQTRSFEIAKLFKVDESDLMPIIKGNVCEVFVNNHVHASTRVLLNGKNLHVLDFGLTIDLPEGYKINGRVNSRFTAIGLLAASVYLDEKNRLKFVVINCGPQTPIVMSHRDLLGEIWIEPILCNWI
jgi:hypothetical protein